MKNSIRPRRIGFVAVFVYFNVLAVLVGTVSTAAERGIDACEKGNCLIVKHDDALTAEAHSLVETLRLRLCKRGVHVQLEPDPHPIEESSTEQPKEQSTTNGDCPAPNGTGGDQTSNWWVAHLKVLSDEFILVAVDHLGAQSDEDLIREVPKGPDPPATAWTVALMVEEALIPYLDPRRELTPLGAGLAIIEPPEVGGAKKQASRRPVSYPVLRCLGVGLDMTYLGAVSDSLSEFVLGPRVGVQGLLGHRFVASLSAGWLGTADFNNRATEVKGTVSQVPINLLFGYVLFSHPRFSLLTLGGFSAGFTIFKTSSSRGDGQRTDPVFNPLLQGILEVDINIYGPLAAYVEGGAAFPIRRVVLENNSQEVYRQDWIMPLIGIGLQLWLQ